MSFIILLQDLQNKIDYVFNCETIDCVLNYLQIYDNIDGYKILLDNNYCEVLLTSKVIYVIKKVPYFTPETKDACVQTDSIVINSR